ncbi:MAG TPA: pyridoxal phosphate-dependent aminotransferase [Thermoanaerobaculia bacterium]|nr:pyridoxal phosphate-dependent aminotransferase [Thermoanaerobaculia bacterium]
MSRALEKVRAENRSILDLTESNPTRAGIDYPAAELSEILGAGAAQPYEPESAGSRVAREAIAAEMALAGSAVDPDDIILTASTSEAYSFLFKLLADPDDEIVTHSPSYPLLDHLADLESVKLRRFPLHFHGRWEVETSSLSSAVSERTRAIVVIHPNNPTGSLIDEIDLRALEAIATPLDAPLISDEVFLDYALPSAKALTPSGKGRSSGSNRAHMSLADRSELPLFTLGGLSKSAGLPHWKLAWIRISGPPDFRDRARRGLELIADTFLPASGPAQSALPRLFPLARQIRAAISARLARNLGVLESAIGSLSSVSVLPVEGGWSAVLRIPTLSSEEELTIDLLETAGVLVHPGFFFDFDREGFLVISLLTPPETFEEGVRRLIAHITARIS